MGWGGVIIISDDNCKFLVYRKNVCTLTFVAIRLCDKAISIEKISTVRVHSTGYRGDGSSSKTISHTAYKCFIKKKSLYVVDTNDNYYIKYCFYYCQTVVCTDYGGRRKR